MILSDTDIRAAITFGEIGIADYREEQLRPASYDVTLSGTFLVSRRRNRSASTAPYPLSAPDPTAWEYRTVVDQGATFALAPGDFILGATQERFWLGPEICAQLQGKSTTGRCGVQIHATAGFVDPGFHGDLTLEICNIGHDTILLEPGVRIAQMIFHRLSSKAARPYGSSSQDRYQNQTGATAPRMERR